MIDGTVGAEPHASLRRVMLVDDDPDVHDLVQFALRSGGIQLRVCERGDEAVAAALAFRPDLVLLDYMMPGMDGPQVLRQLRAAPELRRMPVVLLTALACRGQSLRVETGADAVLAKPFDPCSLRASLERVLDRFNG
jgi:two-component system OmpR family response regulator